MSGLRLQLLGLAVLAAAVLVSSSAHAQDEIVSVTRRAYGPNDVGRLVDANWNPVGRARVAAEVATGPAHGFVREVRPQLSPEEASANASAFPAAAVMRRAAANGYVRIAVTETVYQVEGAIGAPTGTEGTFYIHAVYTGRVYQRQFYGTATAVETAITNATHGQPYAGVTRSARLMRGYPALRPGHEAIILQREESGTLQGILGSRGRATGVLVVYRRVPSADADMPRGQMTPSPPARVPLASETEAGDAYDPDQVHRFILTRRAALVRCYERGLRLDTSMQRGTVVLTFTVTAEGGAADVTATSTDLSNEVTSCVQQYVERQRLPTPPPATPTRFEVRLNMSRRE